MRRCWSIGALGLLLGCAQPVIFSDSIAPLHGTAIAPPPADTPDSSAVAKAQARVGLHAQLGQGVLAADAESTIVARVRIEPAQLDHIPRPPVCVALVLDTSGSMAGEAIDEAKHAALEFVEALGDNDRVSLVAFHSVAETLVPLSPLADGGRDQVRKAIDGIEAVGTTDLAGGLVAGFAEVRKGLAEGGAARVVLLSDGKPNDATPLLAQLPIAAQEGITVTALGLGLDYDEELLGKIATTTGGGFHFAESPEELAQVFRDEVLSLQRVVGRNAFLSLVPGPGVTVERVLGQPEQFTGRSMAANLGDLVEGRSRDVFVVLRATGHRAGAPIELLDAHLSFYDAVAQDNKTIRTYVASTASSSREEIGQSHDRDVELHSARALAADDALRAIELAKQGQLKAAKKLLSAALARVKQDAARFDDAELRAKLGELAELRKALPQLVPQPEPTFAHDHGLQKMRRPAAEPPVAAVRALKSNHADAMGALGY
jgi:Ca-activated chloride channel family protein